MSSEELRTEIEIAAKLILRAKYVVALVGAGMSVESGIPPFRGPNGIWTKYGEPNMRGYERFLDDPKAWWEDRLKPRTGWRKELYEKLEAAKPNPGHHALAELEKIGILKHISTQNIDNLHFDAGSKRVAEIHGNTRKYRCTSCNSRFNKSEFQIKEIPPRCPTCGGVVKDDVVMFGEPIPSDVLETCLSETRKCDCMLLLGTSGVVYPAAGFPMTVKRMGGTLIEINPNETEISYFCDVVLQEPAGKALPLIVARVKEIRNQKR